MTIRVTVWGENVHEQKNKVVAEVYPKAIHGTIAAALNADPAIKATTVTLMCLSGGAMRPTAMWMTRSSSVSPMRSGAAWG